MTAPVPLAFAEDGRVFGDKAARLGTAIRAGLPVPPGVAVAASLAAAVAAADQPAVVALLRSADLPPGHVAVRASAVDPGAVRATGGPLARLNVTRTGIVDAIREIYQSGRTSGPVGIVIQQLIDPLAAGVLLTGAPMAAPGEQVVEAAWGLGVVLDSSRIIPDRYRLAADGGVLEQVPGDKDVRIALAAHGGTMEVAVSEELRRVPCLRLRHLQQLHALAARCRTTWPGDLELEFAVAPDEGVYLLQSLPQRPRAGITR